MAFTLGQLKDRIRTSIHGRRLGLDNSDFLVGPKGLRGQVTNATSGTTATEIPNNGIASVITTTDDTWLLEAPVPGCNVKLGTGSSSTGLHTIGLNGATCVSTNGIASSSIVMQGGGAYVELNGLSTGAWMISSVKDSSGSSTVNFTS